jgi:6-phosphogluconolactonase
VNRDCELVRRDDAPSLAAVLADDIAVLLADAIEEHQRASLVVAGGRTPLPVFERLRRLDLDWSRVVITLTDERWVPPSDAASNEGMVRRALLADRAAAATFVPLKNEAATAALGAEAAWRRLEAELPLPFDVVVLGMGEDAHTASLFPGSPGIEAAVDPAASPACVAMTAPVSPTERLSLNLAALAASRQLIVHFTGEAKWTVWQSADDLPIGLTLRSAAARPWLYWSP